MIVSAETRREAATGDALPYCVDIWYFPRPTEFTAFGLWLHRYVTPAQVEIALARGEGIPLAAPLYRDFMRIALRVFVSVVRTHRGLTRRQHYAMTAALLSNRWRTVTPQQVEAALRHGERFGCNL